MKGAFRQIWALLVKDFRRELRTRELTTTTVSFSLLLVLLSSFAFFVNQQTAPLVFPGVLWISIAFTGTLAMTRTFAMERDAGCLPVLSLIPGTWKTLYFAKYIVNLFFIGLFESVLLPFLSIVFGVSLASYGFSLSLITILVTLGFCSLGTLVSAMLVNNKLRDVMMPLLLYPLAIPLLIAGVLVTKKILLNEDVASWLGVLAVGDLLVTMLAGGLFKWVMEGEHS